MPNNINQKQTKKHFKTFRMLLILGYSCKKKKQLDIFFHLNCFNTVNLIDKLACKLFKISCFDSLHVHVGSLNKIYKHSETFDKVERENKFINYYIEFQT